MTARKPLVQVSGALQELPSGDTLEGVQGTLTSGVNIRTLNGQPLLGSGNLTLAGGGITGPVTSAVNHLVTFADTTGSSLQEATFFDTPAVATPPAPVNGDLRWFARSRAGRTLPHFVGPSGLDSAMQPALFGNTSFMWLAGTAATVSINWGVNWIARNAGTGAAQAHPARATTNALTSISRATFGTGTTATGSSGIQSGAAVVWRGNAVGLGGFFFFSRFAVETHEAAMRYMVGLSALNAALNGEPSVQNNTLAIGKDSTDATWQIITRSASAVTKTNTGAAIVAGQVLDFTMFARPNGTDVTFRLADAVSGVLIVSETVATVNLSVNTVFLFAHAQAQSTVGLTAKSLALNRIYVESDL